MKANTCVSSFNGLVEPFFIILYYIHQAICYYIQPKYFTLTFVLQKECLVIVKIESLSGALFLFFFHQCLANDGNELCKKGWCCLYYGLL